MILINSLESYNYPVRSTSSIKLNETFDTKHLRAMSQEKKDVKRKVQGVPQSKVAANP